MAHGEEFTEARMNMAAFPHGVLQKIIFMRNDHVGDLQVLKNADETVLGFLIQACGGFIQEEHQGLHGQDSGQGDQFLLAPGELIGHPVFEALKPQPLHGLRAICIASAGVFPWFKGPKATSSRTVGQKS